MRPRSVLPEFPFPAAEVLHHPDEQARDLPDHRQRQEARKVPDRAAQHVRRQPDGDTAEITELAGRGQGCRRTGSRCRRAEDDRRRQQWQRREGFGRLRSAGRASPAADPTSRPFPARNRRTEHHPRVGSLRRLLFQPRAVDATRCPGLSAAKLTR